MKYRSDIDGLRAVAIIPVLFYHIGLVHVSGGYVGVDVFFVISGFLITSVVAAEIDSGSFSIIRFYERRVRRIFPALFFLLLVCSIVGYFLLMPRQLKDFGSSEVATTLFSSNILFWKKTGYFDDDAALKPLLHTWSLAVEEQYYLIFPPLLYLILGKLRLKWTAISILALASFVCSCILVKTSLSAAFYLPQSRAWELLLGSILALTGPSEYLSKSGQNIVGALGISLIGVAVFGFTSETPFPGAAAVLPCAGAGLVIWAGSQRSMVSRMLGSRPLQGIGLISYSLYLWHWPIIVFMRYFFMRDLLLGEKIAVVVASFAFATFSWRYVEQPFRRRGKLSARKVLFPGAAVVMLLAISFGLYAYLGNGLAGRLPVGVRMLAGEALDINPRQAECQAKSPADILAGNACEFGDASATDITFALFGDSFADALMPGVDAEAKNNHVRGVALTSGGCYPLVGISSGLEQCDPFVSASVKFILDHPSITRIILVGRWTSAVEGTRVGSARKSKMFITDGQSSESSYAENYRVFARAIDRTIAALHGRQIYVIAFIPEQDIDVPRVAGLKKYLGEEEPKGVSFAEYSQRQRDVRAILAEHESMPGFHVLDVGSKLCGPEDCAIIHDGISLYADDNHLSNAGAMYVKDIFGSALAH